MANKQNAKAGFAAAHGSAAWRKGIKMKTKRMLNSYTVTTDAFQAEVEAENLNDAIEEAFDGEGLGKITDLGSLMAKFQKYVADGGWCWIEENGNRVVEIGVV